MKRSRKSRIMNRIFGCETVYKINTEKWMDPELVKKINANLAEGRYSVHHDPGKLMDWQKEIMERNESKEWD